MKICVLEPALAQVAMPAQSKRALQLSSLLSNHQVDSVFLNKSTFYRQLKALKRQNYDVFINLCWGYRDEELPACSEVASSLESLNLPHTSPATTLYDTPKDVMKHIAYFAGIDTPGFVVAETLADVETACRELSFPLFVKPNAHGDCLGIDRQSYVTTKEELLTKTADLIANFDRALIEEYISGREFTVLLAANSDDPCSPVVYQPIEVVFSQGKSFRIHHSQTNEQEREQHITCTDEWLDIRLRDAAKRIFLESNQSGYACVDFRVDVTGELFFLEINSPCNVFNPEVTTAADSVLQIEQTGYSGFLNHILTEAKQRHQRRQKKYRVQKSPIATYGIFAVQDLQAGEVIVSGESSSQKIATLPHLQSHWSASQREAFLRYIYPLSETVMVLRHPDPAEWLVQNHSCNPNTAYQGLNLVALQEIAAGEELTVDFATFRDENRLEFDCQCGAPQCRGNVRLRPCGERDKANV